MGRAPIRVLPSAEFLRSILDYDPATGDLIWKPRRSATNFNAKHACKKAGSISKGRNGGDNKYLVVGFKYEGRYQQFPAHRLIWKMVTGAEPPAMIDHRDGDNFNNRWLNLRPADNGKNLQNAKLRRDNISGVKGVSWDAGHKKWRVTIAVNGKFLRLGRFDTVEAAALIANEARNKLHGNFARMK